MLFNIFRKKKGNSYLVFNTQYIDPKGLFVYHYDKVPNMSYITDLDIGPAYSFLLEQLEGKVVDVLQHSEWNKNAGKLLFNVTYLVLSNEALIEVGNDYVTILHTNANRAFAEQLLRQLSAFKTEDAPNAAKTRIGFAVQQN